MSRATWLTGDVFERLADIEDGSIHSVITSPPYWHKRAYLPNDHPAKAAEIGQESSPGEFIATLLRLTDELWRVLRDDGTIWINLGDTASGSGGAGGDYDEGGQREGQNRFTGSARSSVGGRGDDIPLRKSVCWIPELLGASLAYGRNLLTREPCRQWITRPPVTWCKPSPTPGEIIDKFREATELFVWAAKEPTYYFDLDAVRLPPVPENERTTWNQNGPKAAAAREVGKDVSGHERYTKRTTNPKGAPPLNWWKINTSGYDGAHFATFPPELIRRPVIASCPEGGTILDPFGGSGTTAMVATGHGRNCVSIDIDERNVDLARERIGMFLDVADTEGAA
jgi:site-specific DNA-methyltransferase (adenine-specific)